MNKNLIFGFFCFILVLQVSKADETTEINLLEDFEYIQTNNKTYMFYYGANDNNFKIYLNLTREFIYHKIPFYHTFNESITEKFKKNEDPYKIILYRDFDAPEVEYKHELVFAVFEAFLKMNSLPKVNIFEKKIAQMVFGFNDPILVVIYKENDIVSPTYLDKIADKLHGNILLSNCNYDEAYCKKFARYLGVFEDYQIPTVRIAHSLEFHKCTKFDIGKEEFNEVDIMNFFEDWRHLKLTPYLKTELKSSQNYQNDTVLNIFRSNFNETVMNPEYDVLVGLFESWSNPYRALQPMLEDLAKLFEKYEKKIIVGQIDMENNEIEGLETTKIPEVRLFPAKNKESPVDFPSKTTRTIEQFLLFLQRNGIDVDDIIEKEIIEKRKEQEAEREKVEKEEQEQKQKENQEQQQKEEIVETKKYEEPERIEL